MAEDRRAFGIEVVRYEVPWGEAFEAAEVERLLEQHPDAVAVFATLLETSTGVGHDIEAIGRVVRNSPALLVVDGISGVGAMECRTDAWGIDVLVVGAQKALMTPPGLAFLAVSPRAWRQIESIARPAFYFDLLAYRKAAQTAETPYTPAIPLVEALAESLRLIRSTGIETLWARSKLLSRATLAGIAAVGLETRGQAAGGRRFGRLSAGRDRRQEVPDAAGGAVRHKTGWRAGAAEGPDFSHCADGPGGRGRHLSAAWRRSSWCLRRKWRRDVAKLGSKGRGGCAKESQDGSPRRIPTWPRIPVIHERESQSHAKNHRSGRVVRRRAESVGGRPRNRSRGPHRTEGRGPDKALREADGAICRSGVKITAEALQGNQRLRAIARAGVGVDNIDTKPRRGRASW